VVLPPKSQGTQPPNPFLEIILQYSFFMLFFIIFFPYFICFDVLCRVLCHPQPGQFRLPSAGSLLPLPFHRLAHARRHSLCLLEGMWRLHTHPSILLYLPFPRRLLPCPLYPPGSALVERSSPSHHSGFFLSWYWLVYVRAASVGEQGRKDLQHQPRMRFCTLLSCLLSLLFGRVPAS
jgi:hypothetical protein